MRRLYALLIIVTISFVPCSSSLNSNQGLQSSPWPMFQHDERHTGRSEYDTSNNTGKEIWRFKTEGWVDSSPAIDKDGVIYAGSGGGYLYAIYPNGTLKWKIKLGGWVDSSPAIAEDGTVYIGSTNKCLYAVSPNGTLKWKYKTGDDVVSSPAIGKDGTIYFGSFDGYFYAISPNGTLKWRYKTGNPIHSSPAIAEDGTVYVGSCDGYFYAFYPNGTLKWKYKTGGFCVLTPAIAEDGTVYVASDLLYAFSPNGTLKWTFGSGFSPESPAIAEDGTIYFGVYPRYFYAVYPNGTLKWKIDLYAGKSGLFSSPAIGEDGTIYACGPGAKLYAILPNGTVKWVHQLLSDDIYQIHDTLSSPAIGKDGTIYVGSWFDNEKEPTWGYIHAIKDGMDKGIKIIRPVKSYLYIFDREIVKAVAPIIIGGVTVKADVVSEENVIKVEFYVGYNLRYTDWTLPFEWKWNTWAQESYCYAHLQAHSLSAKAYYNDGDVVGSYMVTVNIFKFFPRWK